MTFGAQTPSQQAFEILDAAIESDEPVLVDAAEMYLSIRVKRLTVNPNGL